MKFCQLIECNMRNIFPENHIQNVVEKLVPDPSLKFKIEHIYESIVSSFMQFVCIVGQLDGYQNILKLSFRPLASISF